MTYSYDILGYLFTAPIPGRETAVAPPPEADWPAGQRPNWTGYAWIYLDYPPIIPPPPRPEPISARQIRLALNQAGLRDMVEAAVVAGSRDLRDWWEYSIEVQRDHPMVEGMIAALSLPPEQADALWVLGAGL